MAICSVRCSLNSKIVCYRCTEGVSSQLVLHYREHETLWMIFVKKTSSELTTGLCYNEWVSGVFSEFTGVSWQIKAKPDNTCILFQDDSFTAFLDRLIWPEIVLKTRIKSQFLWNVTVVYNMFCCATGLDRKQEIMQNIRLVPSIYLAVELKVSSTYLWCSVSFRAEIVECL